MPEHPMTSTNTGARAFAVKFAEALEGAITEFAGITSALQVIQSLPSRQSRPMHFRLNSGGAIRGNCFVEFCEAQASELVVARLGRPAKDAELAGHIEQLLGSAIQRLLPALTSQYGALTLTIEPVTGLAFGGMFVVALGRHADPSEPSVLLYFDAQILASLLESSLTGEELGGRAPVDSASLKLVMDVELNVSLRFGQRRLPLREVLELSSGSVVELDRMVDEPVDLLLDGKVIARGEVVIIDESYGLRVTEIPQPLPHPFMP